MVSYIDFQNRRRPKWRRKNIAPFLIIILLAISSFLIFLYLPSSPNGKDSESSDEEINFPTIYISTNYEIKKDDPVKATFELLSNNPFENIKTLDCNISIRGELSATYPKKGYRIELSKNRALLGMRNDDDWILLANYYDYTRLRVKLSFQLWRSLFLKDPTAILPQSKYTFLYINGKFLGLYLLAEKDDRNLFGIDKATATNSSNSSIIFQAKYPTNFTDYEPDKWEQDWPNEYDGFYVKNKILPGLIDFVDDSSNETFFDPEIGIFSKFNKTNLIDYFLFNFFILHKDFWDKNYFIVRNSNESLFYLIPWDFDMSFGQNATQEDLYNYTFSSEQEIYTKNRLYERLLKNETFRINCSDRWGELRKIWTNNTILKTINDIYNECKNYIKPDLTIWGQSYNPEEYITKLNNWIISRLTFCDGYFKKIN